MEPRPSLFKDHPDARLDALCNDECERLRFGLKKLGVVEGDLSDDEVYTINLKGLYLSIGAR